MQVFFTDDDYRFYIELMKRGCEKHHLEIVAYCLMPNHVHLIAIPEEECSLRLAIGEAHRQYTIHINSREQWQGHLWQGRFASFPMDEA
ncbi:MAG: transposase, partial [Calditrichaeota bacterium]|nr:transposase [Calditrichota bacterium]